MSRRSFVSQQWKTNVKTILAIVSFPLFLLTLSSTATRGVRAQWEWCHRHQPTVGLEAPHEVKSLL